jgi:hypothetical protein
MRKAAEALDRGTEELEAMDVEALSREMPSDFTLRLLDGTTLNRDQAIAGRRQQLGSVLRVDADRSSTRIECLTLSGSDAIVYTKQQYVRTIPDRKNGSPHGDHDRQASRNVGLRERRMGGEAYRRTGTGQDVSRWGAV